MAAVTLAELTTALADALKPMTEAIARFEARADRVDEHLARIDERLATLEASAKRVDAARANDAVRFSNRLRGLTTPLTPLPFDCMGNVWPATVAQPEAIIHLAVSGAETMPGLAVRPSWNRVKSREFLHTAVAGYADDGVETDSEESNKARAVRLKAIEAIGGVYERVIGSTYKL
jgi:hypothetical protein